MVIKITITIGIIKMIIMIYNNNNDDNDNNMCNSSNIYKK